MSAWADQVESEEATNGALANNSDFPTLGEAAKQQPKAKAKKGQKVSLTEFLSKSSGPPAGFSDKSLADKAILQSLPTAPRGGPREEGDGRPGLGGGFRDYGGDRGGAGSRFQRDDRPPREEREPSRADTVDDWGTTRQFVPTGGGGGGGRSGGFGGGGGFADRPPREPRAPSAADGVDDWGSSRKFEPAGPPGPRGGGGGFGDRGDRGDRGPPPASKADLEDSWGRGRDFQQGAPRDGPGMRERREGPPRDVPLGQADRDERWGRRGGEPSSSGPGGAGAEGPGERPRLKLAPRTQAAGAPEQPGAAAAPSGGSQDGSGDGAGGGATRKSGSNPFGAARPREEVLKEKGVDPIKEVLKLEHGEVIRDETPAERELKAEVEALQKRLEDLKAAEGGAAEEEVKALAAEVDGKERDLLKLMAEEDDRVRFSRGAPRPEGGRGGGPGGAPPPRREEGGRPGEAPPQGGAPRRDRW